MQDKAIEDAVAALVAARRSSQRIAALPDGSRPGDIAAAHAVQDATAEALGERVAGWKVAATADGVMRGIILGSRMLPSPAVLPAAEMLPLGIEAEIAFLFDRDLKPHAAEVRRRGGGGGGDCGRWHRDRCLAIPRL